jgi:hypothetical protein
MPLDPGVAAERNVGAVGQVPGLGPSPISYGSQAPQLTQQQPPYNPYLDPNSPLYAGNSGLASVDPSTYGGGWSSDGGVFDDSDGGAPMSDADEQPYDLSDVVVPLDQGVAYDITDDGGEAAAAAEMQGFGEALCGDVLSRRPPRKHPLRDLYRAAVLSPPPHFGK